MIPQYVCAGGALIALLISLQRMSKRDSKDAFAGLGVLIFSIWAWSV